MQKFCLILISFLLTQNAALGEAAKTKTIYYFPQVHRADTMDKSDKEGIKELQYELYQCLEDFNKKLGLKSFVIVEGWRDEFRGQKPEESWKEYLFDETAGLAMLHEKRINGTPEGKLIDKKFYFDKAVQLVKRFEYELSKMKKLNHHDYDKFVLSNGCADKSFKCSPELALETEHMDGRRLELIQEKIKSRTEESIAIVFGSYHAPDIAKKFQSKTFNDSVICNKYYQNLSKNYNY